MFQIAFSKTARCQLSPFSVDELFSTGGFDDLRLWFDLMLSGKESEQPDLSVYRAGKIPKAPAGPYSGSVVVVDYGDWLTQSRQ